MDFLLVEALLKFHWSPEQVVGYFRYKGYPATIYQHIWTDKLQGGNI